MKYLLDTNICIAILKREELALLNRVKRISPDDLALCSIVKAELFFGAHHSQKIEANLNQLQGLYALLSSLPFDDKAAEFYGTVRALLRRAGTPIGDNDLKIASIAQVNDLIMVTRNYKEFIRVPGLRVENW